MRRTLLFGKSTFSSSDTFSGSEDEAEFNSNLSRGTYLVSDEYVSIKSCAIAVIMHVQVHVHVHSFCSSAVFYIILFYSCNLLVLKVLELKLGGHVC